MVILKAKFSSNWKQFVEIACRNKHSNEIKNYLFSEQYVKFGVPQGSILGSRKVILLTSLSQIQITNTHSIYTEISLPQSMLYTKLQTTPHDTNMQHSIP